MAQIFETQFESPVGLLRLRANAVALLSIDFGSSDRRDKSLVLEQACTELNQYFNGSRTWFETPLFLDGTEFQKKCWRELTSIAYGKTITYKDEAIKVGGANYVRAVAQANNKNKFPILIPCHRVIGSDGSLVGYAGGLEIKAKLLQLEKSFSS